MATINYTNPWWTNTTDSTNLPGLNSDAIQGIYTNAFRQHVDTILNNVYMANPFFGALNGVPFIAAQPTPSVKVKDQFDWLK